jgi:O-antigen ligase
MSGLVRRDVVRIAPTSLMVDSPPAAPAGTAGAPLPAAFAVVAGLTAAEIVRQGAFYPADAFVVAVISAGLIVRSWTGIDGRARWVALAVTACTGWWFLSAVVHGRAQAFLPLGASMTAFLAAFLVVRRLDAGQRLGAAQALATIGAGAAVIGLAASVMRWFPLAMPAQNLWRLSTSLTYSDAAGMLLGMALLTGIALDQHRWLTRVDVSLCMAGLVATQSRGAVLGVLVGACVVPMAAARRALRSILAGLVGGLVVVGTSSGPAHHPLAGVVVGAVIVAAGGIRRPRHGRRITRRQVRVTIVATVVAVAFATAALHTPIQRRVELASTSDRITEWHAAFDQWRSSPWIGVGPDRLLTFHAVDGTYAFFAHNEYLQVLAGAGVVGELLLLVAVGTVAVAVRREDTLSSCGVAALAVFAVAGALDFDWHLAVLGLMGGWVCGLAGRTPCPPSTEKGSDHLYGG